MHKKSRTPQRAILAIFAAALLAVIVPAPAQAQVIPAGCDAAGVASLTVALEGPTDAIRPITDTVEYTLRATYKAPERAYSLAPIPITFSARAEDPSWAIVTIDKTVDYIQPEAGTATDEDVTAKVTVALTQNAPAFGQQNIIATAEADEGTCATAVPQKDAPKLVKAGFYERYQARFEKTIWKTGQNAQIQIPMTIDNLGNGAITVNFARNEGTSGALSLALPGPQIVQSTLQGGETNTMTIPIDVQTPFKNGYENRRDDLIIDLRGTATDDVAIKLTDLQLSAVIRTQGVYVPGFDVVAMVGALAAAVFLSRSRIA